MKISEVYDAAALRRQLFPARIVRVGNSVTDRVSTDRSQNSSGGDYDEWHRPVVVSADPTEAMPSGMTFIGIGGRTGRAFYAYQGYRSSSDWFDMCPCCGTYQTSRGTWGFCNSCGGEGDWQNSEGQYSERWSPAEGDYCQITTRKAHQAL